MQQPCIWSFGLFSYQELALVILLIAKRHLEDGFNALPAGPASGALNVVHHVHPCMPSRGKISSKTSLRVITVPVR